LSKRQLIEQLIKSWAQDHTREYVIADPTSSDEGIKKTAGHLTWVIREGYVNLDLLALVDDLDLMINNRSEGMNCSKCNSFNNFAEPNQPDGTLICYSCRTSPY